MKAVVMRDKSLHVEQVSDPEPGPPRTHRENVVWISW